MNKLRYILTTFGCQMNLADSQRLHGILQSTGYSETQDETQADLILFNTCCVRDNAEQRLMGRVRTLASLKRKRPNLIIAISGCVAQNKKDKLLDMLPEVDLVFGPNDIEQLPLLLQKAQSSKTLGEFVGKGAFDGDRADGIILSRPFSAMVNIIRGCTNFCSYCIVPHVRGPEVSREMDEIIKFVKDLANKNVKEITLLGQNVNAYGKDLGMSEGFATLLEELNEIEGIDWIRFLTSHPRDFSQQTIDRISDLNKVCKHFHLPVQAGSNKVLENMRRGYSRQSYLQLVNYLRDKIPDCSITTDIICGFPGENEQDFLDTLSLVKEVEYDSAFMYYFSPREGTDAAKSELQIPEETRKERLARLIELQNQIGAQKSQKLISSEFKVLVEAMSSRNETRVLGKTETSRPVDFAGSKELIGRFVKVKITKARNWTLSGEMIQP